MAITVGELWYRNQMLWLNERAPKKAMAMQKIQMNLREE